MNKNNLIYLLAVLAVILVIVIVVLLVNNGTPASEDQSSIHSVVDILTVPEPEPPEAPTNLEGSAISSSEIKLTWVDNSKDEDGFRIYRDGVLISTVPARSVVFRDTGLQPGETFTYSVIAYNENGKSPECTTSVKTRNIKLYLTLNSIGVHDNRESTLRGNGDIYLLIGIGDGNKSFEIRMPGEGQYYSMEKDSTIELNSHLYTSDGTSDSLQLFVIGYESDGGDFEQLAYDALEIALGHYTGGISTSLLEIFDISISDKIGEFLGEEDDFMGSYELTCNKQNNFGIGQYIDVVL